MNPLLTWTQLAWKTGEMARDSARVIASRTHATADHDELILMGCEKGEAALESMQAMGLPLMRMYQQMAELGLSQMASLLTLFLSFGPTHTATQTAQQQVKMVDEIKRSIVASTKVAGSGAAVARAAITPVHRRVKANVTRLSKKSRLIQKRK